MIGLNTKRYKAKQKFKLGLDYTTPNSKKATLVFFFNFQRYVKNAHTPFKAKYALSIEHVHMQAPSSK